MTNNNFSSTAAFIWQVADLLRGEFKQSQYGRVILPFTLLRRLECVLEASKDKVLAENDKVSLMNLPEEAAEKFLLRATFDENEPSKKLAFFNTSPMSLGKMGHRDIKANLEDYVQAFSIDIREIFEHFKFAEFVGQLNEANLLYNVVKKFATTDLSPTAISNHDMGLVFEELVLRFAESASETAGEHFTPRDIVRLTTSLVFMEDDDALTKPGIIRTVYDPTAGTGGFLSAGMEYVHELNPNAVMRAFGQELNPESYAICKADMLIKGQDVSRIKLGNTLSNDQLPSEQFDYMLSNPPFGVDWKKIEGDIKDERTRKGFDGRFGAGLPRVSDGSLLFLMHLISKLRQSDENTNGGRIGIILNGSPLFTGGAGSGESEIRRYVLESDLLEAIVALPTDMFYNTGIATYVWVLSNKKDPERKGKVQLINGAGLSSKMRKSKGSKRNYLADEEIRTITRNFGDFTEIDTKLADEQDAVAKHFAAKIFDTHEFGYRRISIERPLRLKAAMTDEAIESLRFAPKPFNAPMQAIFDKFGQTWLDNNGNATDNYAMLSNEDSTLEAEVRAMLKADFPELKEKQIKDLLASKLWLGQLQLLNKAKQLQAELGKGENRDFNDFDLQLKAALKNTGIKLDAKEKKQLVAAITDKDQNAEAIVKKIHKSAANPLYGLFEYQGTLTAYQGKVVEYEQDGDLRDNENVQLDPSITTTELIESYFQREVKPHFTDAWVNVEKKDKTDKETGLVGYEIHPSFFANKTLIESLCFEESSKHKIKHLIARNDQGRYYFDMFSGELVNVFTTRALKGQRVGPRVNIDEKVLDYQYYNEYLKSHIGRDWLQSLNGTGVVRLISFEKWYNATIELPSLALQRDIRELIAQYEQATNDLKDIGQIIFSESKQAKRKLLPYKNIVNQFESSFTALLPTPLAILWQKAESCIDALEKIDKYLKFYEYIGVTLVAIAKSFAIATPIKKKSITMGWAWNALTSLQEDSRLVTTNLVRACHQDVVDLLREMTAIRNDYAHRGMPSSHQRVEALSRIERANENMQMILCELFEDIDLVRPGSATFDGENYEYSMDILTGVGVNPSRTMTAKSDVPLVTGQLYVANNNTASKNKIEFKPLFPLIRFEEVIEQTDIRAFYFWSDILVNEEGIRMLRYICPYPSLNNELTVEQTTLKDFFSNDQQ